MTLHSLARADEIPLTGRGPTADWSYVVISFLCCSRLAHDAIVPSIATTEGEIIQMLLFPHTVQRARVWIRVTGCGTRMTRSQQ